MDTARGTVQPHQRPRNHICSQRVHPPDEKPLAIAHVTVVDATGAAPLPDHTVVVSRGLIVAMGHSARVPIPSDARVVPGHNKYLIPGLWDMHVHTLLKSGPDFCFPLFLANGVMGVRDMGSHLSVDQVNVLRQEIAEGKRLGPRIVSCGPIVDGPTPIWPFSVCAGSAEEGRQRVAELDQQGVDFVKVYSLLPRDAYFGIAAEALLRRVPFAGHVAASVSILEATNMGQATIEHMNDTLPACSSQEPKLLQERRAALGEVGKTIEVRRRQRETILQSYDARRAGELFRALAANGTWVTPTLVVNRAVAYMNEPSCTVEDPRLRYVPMRVRQDWQEVLSNFRFKELFGENTPITRAWYSLEFATVGAMRSEGVRLLAGTDLGVQYIFPGFSLHDELALLVEAGLSPMEALQSATRNPAEAFGMQDVFGTVQVGRVADLILLDADPLSDIRNTQRIASVIVDGTLFDRTDLDRILAESEERANRQ